MQLLPQPFRAETFSSAAGGMYTLCVVQPICNSAPGGRRSSSQPRSWRCGPRGSPGGEEAAGMLGQSAKKGASMCHQHALHGGRPFLLLVAHQHLAVEVACSCYVMRRQRQVERRDGRSRLLLGRGHRARAECAAACERWRALLLLAGVHRCHGAAAGAAASPRKRRPCYAASAPSGPAVRLLRGVRRLRSKRGFDG